MSVLLILGRFYRKRTKNCKIWVISKVHAAAKVPSPQHGREEKMASLNFAAAKLLFIT